MAVSASALQPAQLLHGAAFFAVALWAAQLLRDAAFAGVALSGSLAAAARWEQTFVYAAVPVRALQRQCAASGCQGSRQRRRNVRNWQLVSRQHCARACARIPSKSRQSRLRHIRFHRRLIHRRFYITLFKNRRDRTFVNAVQSVFLYTKQGTDTSSLAFTRYCFTSRLYCLLLHNNILCKPLNPPPFPFGYGWTCALKLNDL